MYYTTKYLTCIIQRCAWKNEYSKIKQMSHGTCRTLYFQHLLILTIIITGASRNLIYEVLICEFYRVSIFASEDVEYHSGTTSIILLIPPIEFIYIYIYTILTSLHLLMQEAVSLKRKYALNKLLVFNLQCLSNMKSPLFQTQTHTPPRVRHWRPPPP